MLARQILKIRAQACGNPPQLLEIDGLIFDHPAVANVATLLRSGVP